MTATSTRTDGLLERYYAPEFLIEVEGQTLDPSSKGDVLELSVEMSTKDLSSAQVRFNNYDDTLFDLKWSEGDVFNLGNVLHVQMGYAERLVSMLRGPITTLAPEFLSDGPPTLLVTAMDPLVRLKGAKPPEDAVIYREKADWQIAEQIAQRHHLRFESTREGPEHELVVQGNDDDIVFLKKRAAHIDFDVFMRTEPESGDDILYFVRPTDGRAADALRTYVLAWGTLRNNDSPPSLIEFKPTISAGDQVESVTVRGWDFTTKQAIVYTATPENTEGVSGSGDTTGPAAATALASSGVGKGDVVIDAPVFTEEEAKSLAEAKLADRAYEFVNGTGKAIGLPDLRPGDNVEIQGVGNRFSGRYFVTRVKHTIDSNGFVTEFDGRKTYAGELE